MRRPVVLVVAAAVLVVAAAALAGCGFASFGAEAAPDMQALAADAGVVILNQGSAENRYAGGTSAEWYELGAEGSDKVAAVVSVLRFENQTDRNEAYRQITYRMTRGAPPTVVYTVGDAVVEVSSLGDYDTAQALDDALEAAGAK